MQGDHDAEERKQLKMAMRADPDGIADLIFGLERRIEELEVRLKMDSRSVHLELVWHCRMIAETPRSRWLL